jgi:nucleotide-binding universal stress UspA family protein
MTTLTESEDHGPLRARAPVVAAVDNSASSQAAIEAGVALARELNAPLVFAYVRRGPGGFLGSPVYQRRLTKKMEEGERALADALHVAEVADVEADGMILEGSPSRRIVELARARGARMVVVGRRRRRLGRSVSRAVVRAARRPVIVAQGLAPPTWRDRRRLRAPALR